MQVQAQVAAQASSFALVNSHRDAAVIGVHVVLLAMAVLQHVQRLAKGLWDANQVVDAVLHLPHLQQR